ncbi:MAG: tetratricopeptide repeat protein [Candidatus Omnitrophica bacterium]|nr:tetratricopeptide repeat protein [Candidatus Omnitrophota bacterium]
MNFKAVFLIIVLGFILYANSLNGQFIWDDEFLVRDNYYIRSCSNLMAIFTTGLGAGSGKDFQYYYRPLHMASYIVDYSVWKLNVIGYHLTNILLHILITLCICLFVLLLYDDKRLAFLTGILFLTHPIQVEAVASISIRGDLLSALFLLLSFILYIKSFHTDKAGLFALALLSYILALLSKENSLIFPVLLLLYHYIFKKRINFKVFASILVITSAYILLRSAILKSTSLWIGTIPQRIPGFFAAITNYVQLLLFPFNLHAEYGCQLFNFRDPRVILGVIITLFLLYYSFRKKKNAAIIFFSVCWFFIALLPVSNIYPLAFYMTEHWLYLPSIGFFLLLAYGINKLFKIKYLGTVPAGFTAILIIFYSYLTIAQNNYWKEPISFYERTLRYTPDSTIINNNLAIIYNQMKLYDKAVPLLVKAITIDPYYAEAYANLGVSLCGLGKKEDAIKAYETSIKLNPTYREAYYNMGNLYYHAGETTKAIELYKKALEIDPNFADAYFNLGVAANDIGQQEEAVKSFLRVIERDPEYISAYNNLAAIYIKNRQFDKAISLLGRVMEINPRIPEIRKNLALAYYNLSISYFQAKQYDLAVEYCDKAEALGFSARPDFLKDLAPYRNR